MLTVESQQENAFNEDDIRLLSILSLQVAVGMRNARMYAEIEKMAVTDPLTGLYNYRYFYQRLGAELARCERYHHPLSVIMVDLDDFKKINDHCGHLFGDRVLRETAQAIRGNIRRYDEPLIVHTGGDRHRLALRRRGVHRHPARHGGGGGPGLRRAAQEFARGPLGDPAPACRAAIRRRRG